MKMNVSTVAKYHRFAGLHFDPVRDVTEFIRDCRNSGMNKSKIIGAMVDQLHYMPTEADIIVDEFWDKTA